MKQSSIATVRHHRVVSLVPRVTALLLSGVAHGAAPTAARCASKKIAAAGATAQCLIGLEAKRQKTGVAPQRENVQKCKDNLAKAIAKIDASNPACLTIGDAAARQATIDALVAALRHDLAECPVSHSITLGSGSSNGYMPLTNFGITPTAIGDDQLINFDTAPFLYAGVTYTRIAITSNGYAVVGGTNAPSSQPVPQSLPNTQEPNGVLAPFWSDLDGSGAPGIYGGVLSQGSSSWQVFEWRVHPFGNGSIQDVFQLWIGLNGVEDLSFAYDPNNRPTTAGLSEPLTIGAESANGCAGAQLTGAPTGDVRVISTP